MMNRGRASIVCAVAAYHVPFIAMAAARITTGPPTGTNGDPNWSEPVSDRRRLERPVRVRGVPSSDGSFTRC